MNEPSIEARLSAIEHRNQRVAADKAWETSLCRKASVAGVTYLVACAFLFIIGTPNWPIAALMPVFGYLLSTITLRTIKHRWIAHYCPLPNPPPPRSGRPLRYVSPAGEGE